MSPRYRCRGGRTVYLRNDRVDPPTLPPSSGRHDTGRDDERVRGVVVVFSRGAPAARAIRLADGVLEVGRSDGTAGRLDDGRVSRRHALVKVDGARWVVTDLGSQNGTFVDGKRAAAR